MIKINLLRPEKKEVAAGGGTTVSYVDEAKPSGFNVPALVGAIALTVIGIGLMYFLQNDESVAPAQRAGGYRHCTGRGAQALHAGRAGGRTGTSQHRGICRACP